ncbi:MAG: PBP1A family penicillin-binding protein [Acidobacteriota bacterium]|nr:PBP1A family penicillin-binding protein [Acidobacteriota bacterium]
MASQNKLPSRKRKNRLPVWLWVFFFFLIISFAVVGAGFGILLGYEYNLPKIQSLEDYRPDVITDVYSDDNKVIGELFIEKRMIVSYEEIPPYLQLAIIATEDDQFYKHSGINYYSIIRAVFKDFIRQSYPVGKGASTITQQLARMLIDNFEKTYDRKIKEVLIAWKIERQYSKQQILTLYANLLNMGPGIYGVAAAADYYFGKQLKDLTLEECALLAGLPSNPTLYSPRLHPQTALGRRNLVLDRMAREHMISAKLAAETKMKPLVLKPSTPSSAKNAPHFLEWVRMSLADRYSTEEIWRRGLRVYTTLNIEMQTAARTALREGLRRYDKARGWRGAISNILKDPSNSLGAYVHPSWRNAPNPEDIVVGLIEEISGTSASVRTGKLHGTIGPKEIEWTKAKTVGQILKPGDLAYFKIVSINEANKTASLLLEQRPAVEGAIIILQNSTGEIKAMVGGYDFESSEFNRATQAMRQVGSTFKPIVYAAALEKGMTPDSSILDAPISFADGLGRTWSPGNYDGKFEGQITIRRALTQSRNVPTIKVASLIGIKNVVVMARRFGLSGTLDPYLPLALGSCEATPLEMASAFTVFPNLGMQAKPYFIRRVEDYDRLKKEESIPQTHQVLSPEIAEKMLGLLQDVVQSGTATAAKSIGRPLGGKTGTTNDFTDAWFVGFTPSITAAVWVGYDQKKTLGERQSGAAVALPIWIETMQSILKDKPVEQFQTATPPEPPTDEAPLENEQTTPPSP